MKTTRFDLPIPLDQPVTGQTLLDVMHAYLDPILSVMGRVTIGSVASTAPLLVIHQDKEHAGWAIPGYAPANGTNVVCLLSDVAVIVLGTAP